MKKEYIGIKGYAKKWFKSYLTARNLEIVEKSPAFIDLLAYSSYKKESLELKKFLNIGAGSFFYHPFWSRHRLC